MPRQLASLAVAMLVVASLSLADGPAMQETAPVDWKFIGPGVYGVCWGVAFHPRDPRTMIAGLDMGAAFITRDGGASWKRIDAGIAFTTGFTSNDRILFDPADRRHVFFLLSAGVLEGRFR